MKILLIGTQLSYIYNFRLGLINKFKEKGNDVYVISCKDCELKQDSPFTFIDVELNNSAINPIKIYKYKKALKKAMAEIKPDILFTFTIKPNVYATKIAHQLGIKNIYSMVEGRGRIYNGSGIIKTAMRFYLNFLQKISFRFVNKVFLLNNEDRNYYINHRLLNDKQAVLIPGIGVDLNKFNFEKIPENQAIIMVSRLLPEKGIMYFCNLAKKLKKDFPNLFCYLLGGEDKIKASDLHEFTQDNTITYLGVVPDVRPYLEQSCIFILPSYYKEGVPRSIMEAMAVGRAIITTRNQGCQDTVIEGYNGYLIDNHDEKGLYEITKNLLNIPKDYITMGQNSRLLCEKTFDEQKINDIILSYIIIP